MNVDSVTSPDFLSARARSLEDVPSSSRSSHRDHAWVHGCMGAIVTTERLLLWT